MAIESKILLLKNLEERLKTELTFSDMTKVLEIVADELSSYEVEQTVFEDSSADDLLETYLDALQIQGRSLKTIARYRYIIGRIMNYIHVPTRKVTVYHLRKYLADEKTRGICDNTLEGIREVLTAYFNWLQRECLISINPTANLGPIKRPKKVKETFTDIELEKIKLGCNGNKRDRAIVAFLSATGCRVNEVVQLNRDDIDLVNLECTVLGKGNKERIVYLDSVSAMLIQNYIDSRKDDEEALFINKYRKRIRTGGIRIILNKIGKRVGIDDIYPHKFRRTFATNMIRHGMPIQEVSNLLGHEKIDVTMKYVVLDKSNIKHSYSRYA